MGHIPSHAPRLPLPHVFSPPAAHLRLVSLELDDLQVPRDDCPPHMKLTLGDPPHAIGRLPARTNHDPAKRLRACEG